MIDIHSPCLRNLRIGDAVVVKLLPYEVRYKTFEKPITFPFIGFFFHNTPCIGTMSLEHYNNHHFMTSQFILSNFKLDWTYFMPLNAKDIEIVSIIKGGMRWLRI